MQREPNDIRLSPAQLAAFALAIISAFGYTTMSTRQEVVRPDPYTGSDAARDKAELQREIDMLGRRVDALRENVNLCLARMHEHVDHQRTGS